MIKFKIMLFFKLLKHKIPAFYFKVKYHLGILSYNDQLMLLDCIRELIKDREIMNKELGNIIRRNNG
jgi:hypothetical protein